MGQWTLMKQQCLCVRAQQLLWIHHLNTTKMTKGGKAFST